MKHLHKILPHNSDIEKLVLGTLMQRKNALSEVRDILTPQSFYEKLHRQIYEAILRVDARGDQPDLLTVVEEMQKTHGEDFQGYEFALVGGAFSNALYQHATILSEKEKRRRLYEVGDYLLHSCFDEEDDLTTVLAEARKKLEGVYDNSPASISTLREAIEGVYAQIERNMQGESPISGVPTGFHKYDRQAGGLHKSDLIIIAAETSMGKTSLALSILMNARSKVAIYSMEMKKEQLAARIIGLESQVPVSRILYSRLTDIHLKQVDQGVARISSCPIYFDDNSTSNIDRILTSIHRMKQKYDIDGAVIDYLQILNVNMKGTSKEQQMGDVARRLKNLAKELDIWIIALSQLNRDAQNPMPSLHRLRDSGQIAEATDVVMLIYRPELYERFYPEPFQSVSTRNTAMIDVAKGRNIGLMKFICGFDKETASFYDLKTYLDKTREQSGEDSPF